MKAFVFGALLLRTLQAQDVPMTDNATGVDEPAPLLTPNPNAPTEAEVLASIESDSPPASARPSGPQNFNSSEIQVGSADVIIEASPSSVRSFRAGATGVAFNNTGFQWPSPSVRPTPVAVSGSAATPLDDAPVIIVVPTPSSDDSETDSDAPVIIVDGDPSSDGSEIDPDSPAIIVDPSTASEEFPADPEAVGSLTDDFSGEEPPATPAESDDDFPTVPVGSLPGFNFTFTNSTPATAESSASPSPVSDDGDDAIFTPAPEDTPVVIDPAVVAGPNGVNLTAGLFPPGSVPPFILPPPVNMHSDPTEGSGVDSLANGGYEGDAGDDSNYPSGSGPDDGSEGAEDGTPYEGGEGGAGYGGEDDDEDEGGDDAAGYEGVDYEDPDPEECPWWCLGGDVDETSPEDDATTSPDDMEQDDYEDSETPENEDSGINQVEDAPEDEDGETPEDEDAEDEDSEPYQFTGMEDGPEAGDALPWETNNGDQPFPTLTATNTTGTNVTRRLARFARRQKMAASSGGFATFQFPSTTTRPERPVCPAICFAKPSPTASLAPALASIIADMASVAPAPYAETTPPADIYVGAPPADIYASNDTASVPTPTPFAILVATPPPSSDAGFTGESFATICPVTCNPFDPAANFCDITQTCVTTGAGRFYCACRAGFRADEWNEKDFTKQFKVPGQPFVYGAERMACNTVCSDSTCSEVLERPQCA
jgi:hypothetical protein